MIYQSNLVQKGKKYWIVEADEYDRRFYNYFQIMLPQQWMRIIWISTAIIKI